MHKKTAIWATLLLLLPAMGAGQDLPSETYLDPQCLTSVWAPESTKLANAGRWRHKSSFDRIDLLTDAPTEDGDALMTIARAGVPGSQSMYKQGLDVARAQKPTVTRIQVDLFIPDDAGFNRSNAKMPLGIWGGDPDARFCGMGLCPPRDQTGFTVRLTRSRMDKEKKKPPFTHGPRIYSYHLNRPGPAKQKTNADGSVRTVLQGGGFDVGTPFEPGRWYQVVLDVGLNSFKGSEPVADGWTDMYLLDEDGHIIGYTGQGGLIYRKSPDWHILGPILGDLWGGDETRPQNLPLADTLTYFEDYEMFLLAPGKTPQQCLSRPG